MAVYSAITTGEKDPESPIDVSLVEKLDQNPEAMIEGASGAPRVQTAALDQTGGSEAVTAATMRSGAALSNIGSGNITQTYMGASSIGQGQLKTTSGEVSSSSGTASLLTLPGGAFGFYAQTRKDFSGSASVEMVDTQIIGTTSASYITLYAEGANSVYAKQTYVQASPPYDLGDGEIPLFIFAEIDSSTGDVVSAYEAPEAPWHYNGPTNIKADYYNKSGAGYQRKKDATEIDSAMVAAGHAKGLSRASAKALSILAYQDYLAAFNEAKDVEVEISQDIKNADMDLISKPMSGTANTTVVMLDPVSDLGASLAGMKKHDEFNINELLHDGDLIITDEVVRAGPQGVPVHSYKWR